MTAPPELEQALVALYLLADFGRHNTGRPEWFKTHGVLAGISQSTTRRIALRFARRLDCVACSAKLSENSTGDHILALAEGGPPGLENYLPLCQRCNSSKGKRDLLWWWQHKQRPFCALPPDALTAYSRLHYDRATRLSTLHTLTPAPLAAAVSELSAALPSEAHRWFLRQRVSWMTGRRWL